MALSLTLENASGLDLIPFPVDPGPPPGRVEDAANTVAAGATQAIEVTGFNPVYASALPSPFDDRPNGFIVQLAPPEILVVTYRYQVKPGQEGADPAQQPIQFEQFHFDNLTDGDYALRAKTHLEDFSLTKQEGAGAGAGGGCLVALFSLPWFVFRSI